MNHSAKVLKRSCRKRKFNGVWPSSMTLKNPKHNVSRVHPNATWKYSNGLLPPSILTSQTLQVRWLISPQQVYSEQKQLSLPVAEVPKGFCEVRFPWVPQNVTFCLKKKFITEVDKQIGGQREKDKVTKIGTWTKVNPHYKTTSKICLGVFKRVRLSQKNIHSKTEWCLTSLH